MGIGHAKVKDGMGVYHPICDKRGRRDKRADSFGVVACH